MRSRLGSSLSRTYVLIMATFSRCAARERSMLVTTVVMLPTMALNTKPPMI